MSRHRGEFDFAFNEKDEQYECDDCNLFAIVQDQFDANMCEEHYIEATLFEQADLHMKAIKEFG